MVVSALVADAGLVHRALATTLALSPAGALEAEVRDTSVVALAELAELGKTFGRALVVNADVRGASLVLVAVRSSGLDGLALGVGAEGAIDTLGRLAAARAVLQSVVGNAALVDTVAGSAARVLVASVAILLDVLARASVAVGRALALLIGGAERVVLASAVLRNTFALVTRVRGTVAVPLAAGAWSGGGSRAGSARHADGSGRVAARVVVERGGHVLEHLAVHKVTGDGLSHLERRNNGDGGDKSSTERSTHLSKLR